MRANRFRTLPCRNCGKSIQPNEEYYKEGYSGHCIDCHEKLYPNEEDWLRLAVDGQDENGEDIINEEYYFTSLPEEENCAVTVLDFCTGEVRIYFYDEEMEDPDIETFIELQGHRLKDVHYMCSNPLNFEIYEQGEI